MATRRQPPESCARMTTAPRRRQRSASASVCAWSRPSTTTTDRFRCACYLQHSLTYTQRMRIGCMADCVSARWPGARNRLAVREGGDLSLGRGQLDVERHHLVGLNAVKCGAEVLGRLSTLVTERKVARLYGAGSLTPRYSRPPTCPVSRSRRSPGTHETPGCAFACGTVFRRHVRDQFVDALGRN